MSATADPIVVVAKWQTTAGAAEGVLALVEELRRQSLAEAGCLGYEVFRSVDAPGDLLLVERYADTAAIEAHRQSAHYQDLVVTRILPLLANRRVELLQARAGA